MIDYKYDLISNKESLNILINYFKNIDIDEINYYLNKINKDEDIISFFKSNIYKKEDIELNTLVKNHIKIVLSKFLLL